VEIPPDLRVSLDSALAGIGVREAAGTVERLIEVYRSGSPAAAPILSTMDEVLAYAGYRMPATYSAVRAALHQVGLAVPALVPRRQLDLGGGTGAAAWAAMEQFPSLTDVLVVDQAGPALNLGRDLAARSRLHRAQWQPGELTSFEPEPADLVTLSYVLGELPPPVRDSLVRRAAAAAGTLVVVEPGTPAGYERILAARQVALAAGLTIVAPCPHQAACPMIPGKDWCHFSVRVNRSSVHRRLKGGELGYEDEKFSYVAAVRSDAPAVAAVTVAAVAASGRVLRRPTRGKGLVSLYLCTPSDGLAREVVSKRQGPDYRAARDVSWGDQWPPQVGAPLPGRR
jgi:ribosomal protein RSM22 (predicted rRNA methylase)